jgi:hypothetical protein
VVNKSGLSLSYTIDGKSNIPSDGETHKVSVTELPFDSEITYITTPAKKAEASMQASTSTLNNL